MYVQKSLSEADPGFLERGFICIKLCVCVGGGGGGAGGRIGDCISFFLNISWK